MYELLVTNIQSEVQNNLLSFSFSLYVCQLDMCVLVCSHVRSPNATCVTGTQYHGLTYMIRLRDKQLAGELGSTATVSSDSSGKATATAAPSVFFNGFVTFRDVKEARSSPNDATVSTSATQQLSLVLLTRWPFPQLAYQVLDMLVQALLFQLSTLTQEKEAKIEDENAMFQSMLMAAFGQLLSWPSPKAGSLMYVPFFGEVSTAGSGTVNLRVPHRTKVF